MSKSRQTIYTGLTSIALTLVSGLSGLIVTRIIIVNYGSDFNGLNSTVTQFINMMLIIEGGFTLASSVALFKPLTDKNYSVINGIISASRVKFNKIGLLFLAASFPISILYSYSIKTNIDLSIVILVFGLLILSTFFNLIFTSKYRILLQTDQREYIINTINIFSLIITQSIVGVLAIFQKHILLLRLCVFIGTLASQLVISAVSCKKYRHYNYYTEPLFSEIKGTRDVFVQRLISVIFNTFPILIISSTVGTLYASVYFVYNSVLTIIRSVLYSIVNAPLMSLGKLISETSKEYVFKVFIQYEYIVNNFILLLLSVTSVLIIPFVKIYSKGVSDVIYTNRSIALLIILTAFFEMIHIPCGNILNMSGLFHIIRKIQLSAGLMLVTSIVIFNYLLGLTGILLGVLVTSIFLACLEIVYVYNRYFEQRIGLYLRNYIPLVLIVSITVFVEIMIMPGLSGYFEFVISGIILISLNSAILTFANIFINRDLTKQVYIRIKETIRYKAK